MSHISHNMQAMSETKYWGNDGPDDFRYRWNN